MDTCDVGIVGAGQLADMMIDAAHALGLKVAVLAESVDEPAFSKADFAVLGKYRNKKDIAAFSVHADAITFDLENVDVDALIDLEKNGKKVFPSTRILSLIQDKLLQKQFFISQGFPTSPLHMNEQAFPYILKTRRGGYDGKGVWKIKDRSDLPNVPSDNLLRESLVTIQSELAVLVARAQSGETVVYDLVEMFFHEDANMLDYLICPAQVDLNTQETAKNLAKRLIEKLEGVGLFAVELFLTDQNEILINEVAPRPHNSGHFTIEACAASQFENHIRAVCGMPLGSAKRDLVAAMFNVIGEKGFEGPAQLEGQEELNKHANTFLHWYRKKDTKPFRKMGHVTLLRDSIEAFKNIRELSSQIRCVSKTKEPS